MKRFSEISLIIVYSFLAILMPQTLNAQLSWQATNSEIDYPIYKFVTHDNYLYAAFYGAGVYKTADEGETWLPCHNGLTNFLARDVVVAGDNLFVGTNGGGIFKSTDNGDTWSAVNDELNQDIWSLLAINNRLFAGTTKGLFYSDDSGNTWQAITLPLPKGYQQIIFSLGTKDGHILAGSNSHVYLSEDRGETWKRFKVPTNLDINTITIQNNLWLLGTSGDGIISSQDGKDWNFWNKQTGNTRSLVLVKENVVLGAAIHGVLSIGNDLNAVGFNEGFTSPAIRSVGYHDGKLYAGTFRQGIWRYDIPKGDVLPSTTTYRSTKAVNIYPNPVDNAWVTLTYNLAENTTAQIHLFDAFGKNIAQIAPLSEQYKGVHQVSYDMNGLGAGTYYVHLQLGEELVTKSIVLIK